MKLVFQQPLKACSARFINERGWIHGKFSWQGGFGAFTYSRSQLDTVIKYILRQEEHHQKTTFKAEYVKILKNFEVEYDEQYLFHWNEL